MVKVVSDSFSILILTSMLILFTKFSQEFPYIHRLSSILFVLLHLVEYSIKTF
jgi:hypothetical protein